jgi:rRNA maturation endonuclease Nob1
VDYLGDDHFHQAMQHGNSKHDSEFVRTMPSVVEETKCKEGDPHKVYKKMICTNFIEGSHQAVANPRNTKQVKNILSQQKYEKALSKDDIYNLFLLAYQLNGFISEIWCIPIFWLWLHSLKFLKHLKI